MTYFVRCTKQAGWGVLDARKSYDNRGRDRDMKRDICVFLFSFGVLLFGGPFLFIFRDSLTYYLFISWFVFIGLIFLVSKYSKREDGEN
jgi:hypothetical protein